MPELPEVEVVKRSLERNILNLIIKKVKINDGNLRYKVNQNSFLKLKGKKITKIKPKLSTTGGTSDARFLKNISPCLEFGLVGKTMHKVDEAVSLNDLKKLTKIYANILNNYF